MDSCKSCGSLVDTDSYPEFYDFSYTTASGYGGHCEPCRDDILERMTAAEQVEHEKRVYGGVAA